ncbi:hypothetical protein H310_14086 [Aphanomyces invadans]|uniref:AraC effector-binding domain-containing protein n=1 Tax=Aphanomyces invadans TaxID=157072 RepID=A0A024TB23_9STRA|nr:hypothetical protein H310_14086 [Aphanomyces invadans]ETV91209.1 hypothetical protein H310_14086 [Aphanomyces invadans]|eukprot:XP_008880046.1 hypothetical protein H310_14086 [Aphanomyces invadans]
MAKRLAYTITHAPQRLIAGLQTRATIGPCAAIHELWHQFCSNVGAKQSYGVCYDFMDGVYTYLAGLDVKVGEPLPDGWVSIAVPEQSFAVFEHNGDLSTISNTWSAIVDSDDGIKSIEGEAWDHSAPTLEVFPSNFKNGGGPVTIWIPLVPKAT